jgi:hypothetical protein
MAKKKDKHYFSKFWVSVLILTILAYVAAVFYCSWHGRSIPDSLTYTFLPAIIAQLTNMMLIARKGKDVEIAHIEQQGNEQNIL